LRNLGIDGRIILICSLVYKYVDWVEDKLQWQDFDYFCVNYLFKKCIPANRIASVECVISGATRKWSCTI
jgi:hypothetical protein